MNTIILHTDVFTPAGIISDAILTAENGVITRIEPYHPAAPLPSGKVVDAAGLLASPGWIDIQINGAFGYDFTNQPDSIWETARLLPRFGITAFLPTIITSPLETHRRAIQVWKAGPPSGWQGAIPLGFHFEGPFLNPGKKGAHNPQYILPPDPQLIQEWHAENGLRLVTLAPELPGAHELIHELRRRGVVVSAGHSLATYEQAVAAFEAGISCATHLFNAMPALDHRAPGLVGALLTHPEIPAGLIADGIHTHPAFLQLAWTCKGTNGIILVTDAISALGMPPGEHQLGEWTIFVDEQSVRLKDGTLAGSILNPQTALQNMMSICGAPLEAILPTLTLNPARLLGLNNKGRLEVGCDADITLITRRGEVQATIVGGEVMST
ncbi:MAG: N-acetylglucosamine-6-phosphate deacetylase [Chloroflexota bacterium]